MSNLLLLSLTELSRRLWDSLTETNNYSLPVIPRQRPPWKEGQTKKLIPILVHHPLDSLIEPNLRKAGQAWLRQLTDGCLSYLRAFFFEQEWLALSWLVSQVINLCQPIYQYLAQRVDEAAFETCLRWSNLKLARQVVSHQLHCCEEWFFLTNQRDYYSSYQTWQARANLLDTYLALDQRLAEIVLQLASQVKLGLYHYDQVTINLEIWSYRRLELKYSLINHLLTQTWLDQAWAYLCQADQSPNYTELVKRTKRLLAQVSFQDLIKPSSLADQPTSLTLDQGYWDWSLPPLTVGYLLQQHYTVLLRRHFPDLPQLGAYLKLTNHCLKISRQALHQQQVLRQHLFLTKLNGSLTDQLFQELRTGENQLAEVELARLGLVTAYSDQVKATSFWFRSQRYLTGWLLDHLTPGYLPEPTYQQAQEGVTKQLLSLKAWLRTTKDLLEDLQTPLISEVDPGLDQILIKSYF